MANYEHYKIFCKVVECRSISKAANQLYVSQPAISAAIKQLETTLNVRLLFRGQKGVITTTEGSTLYSYVKQGCTLMNVGEEKLKELSALQAGEINIGASDTTLRYLLFPFIEKFHSNFPLVKMKITNSPTPETLQSLKEGLIDFGVVSEPVDCKNSNFNFKVVKSVKDILVAGNKFKQLKDKQKVPVKELHKYPFVMLEKGTSTRQHIDNYLRKNKAEINPEIELAANDSVIEFIRRGMCIGFALEECVAEDIRSELLYKVNLYPEMPGRQFYIVTHTDIPLASAAKKFLEYNNIDMSGMNAKYDRVLGIEEDADNIENMNEENAEY